MAKLSQVFDMRVATSEGANILDPNGNRGPPGCFTQKGGSDYEIRNNKSNPFYNNPQNKNNQYRGQFINAEINNYEMGVPVKLANTLPNYYNVTNGSIDEELEDGLGSAYTRLAAANELNSGINKWNGQYTSYPEDDGENKGSGKMAWVYKDSHQIHPSKSIKNPKLFYPRVGQPNVYQLAYNNVKSQMYDEYNINEMISLGPIMIKKNWLTWILIFILAFFVFDKMLLSFMMMMKSKL